MLKVLKSDDVSSFCKPLIFTRKCERFHKFAVSKVKISGRCTRRLEGGKFPPDDRLFDPNTGYTCIAYTVSRKRCDHSAKRNPSKQNKIVAIYIGSITNRVIMTLRNDKSTFVCFIYKPDCSYFFFELGVCTCVLKILFMISTVFFIYINET